MNAFEAIAEKVHERVDFAPLQGKTVLVTGGSGLLGTHIVAILHQLLVNDYYFDLHVQVQRDMGYYDEPYGMTVHYANLANSGDCARLPNADVVISAASYAQPLRFLSERLLSLRSASYGLMALLERCNVGGRFLYISSSEVYCDSPHTPPFREDQTGSISPYHPRACYIEAKRWGEAMTYLYRERGLSTVAVRPGITYGPGVKPTDQRSWAQFIHRALTMGKIELMDAGKVRRTFCYVADAMELLFQALLYGTQPVYNLSGKTSLSIAELAELIGKITKVPVIIPEEDHGVAGTPDDLQLDTSLIEHEFPKPTWVGMEEGMTETVNWTRRMLEEKW